MQNREFLDDFVQESITHLDELEMGLIRLGEAGIAEDSQLINTLFRTVHSIKGTAGFFALDNIVALAHAMEHRFGEMRKEGGSFRQELLDLLLQAGDRLRAMVLDAEASNAHDVSDLLALLSDEATTRQPPSGPEAEPHTADADSTETEAAADAGRHSPGPDDTVRVRVALLNDLLNLAGELVLGRNQLLRSLHAHRKAIPGLNGVLQHLDNVTTEMQEKIMLTRMQPVSKLFNKFPRVIRDMSLALGKEIEFRTDGTEVELDKSLLEALADPLNHLIRNAIDHGIELPAQRLMAGKPRTGVVILKAYHNGDHVTIDVADDGAGISLDRIRARAVQRAILDPAAAASADETELLNMLFLPGFSTADEVTNLSGRGVGMDVVRTNIEKIGGSIDIRTVEGNGSAFRITLPLTLAIIPSLVVEAEGRRFALPRANLEEMVRIRPQDSTPRLERLHQAWALRLRDKLLPAVHLADVLGLRNGSFDREGEVFRVLVLRIGSERYGLAVDRIHDSEEILVKPLPRFFRQSACYFGVTIMGDGKPAMILDPEGMASRAELRFYANDPTDDTTAAEGPKHELLLLFGGPGPEVIGTRLSDVARVEKVRTAHIETIGGKEYIPYAGDALRVIRPESCLPIRSFRTDREQAYLIVPKRSAFPIGLLAERIYDTMAVAEAGSGEAVKAEEEGIVGTAVWKDRLVLLVDFAELLEMAAAEEEEADGGEVV